MNKHSFLSLVVALAAALLALALWSSPPATSLASATPAPAVVAESPAAVAAEFVAVLARFGGTSLLALLAAAGIGYVAVVHSRRGRLVGAINTNPANTGQSTRSRRFRASAAVATRYLIGKIGADEDHIAVVSATADQPIGVLTDEPAAAEDPVDVELLGISERTQLMVAGEAIDEGEAVYTTAAGKVQDKPTAAGTYWKVGVAATPAAADGNLIEVYPCTPRKLIVVSALESTNGTAAAAVDLNALKAEAEKIGDDLRKIAAALDGDADVALATT